MEELPRDIKSMFKILGHMHESLSFNRLLGLKVVHLEPNRTECYFAMKKEFIGNPIKGILHGGVISAALDAVGGMNASASALEKMKELSFEEIGDRISRMGTVDLRIDYLRPGRGEKFIASSTIMRSGSKIAVTRMELKNEKDILIATGTGAYLVG